MRCVALAGSLSGYKVDRLEHSLQCASRAYRDGAEEELVVAALLHDIGDLLSPFNHSELAAAVLRPYVCRTHTIGSCCTTAYFRTITTPTIWVVTVMPVTPTGTIPGITTQIEFCHRWDQFVLRPDL